MASSKENMHRLKGITRIPLPLDPLPALPIHLIKKTNAEELVRYPLRTLSESKVNSTDSRRVVKSQEKVKKRRKVIRKIDTRYVTTRDDNEVLDWQYRVFKDDIIKTDDGKKASSSPAKNSVQEPSLSVTPSGVKKNLWLGRKITHDGTNVAVTPFVHSIEHKGVRNVKRSLKRPHSRELQGLSPKVDQKRKSDERVRRQLEFSCQSSGAQADDYWLKCYTDSLTRDYADAVFDHILAEEKAPLAVPRLQSPTRTCIINWLIKVNSHNNGNPTVIQAACWFLDSLLGLQIIPVDRLQLVATACYWIALKIHGPMVSSSKLLKLSGDAFRKVDLLKVERKILMMLDFPRQPIVAQDFINYFSWWCNKDDPEEVEVVSTFICLSGLMVDKILCEEYPSAIAAAAVQNAVVLMGRADLLKKLKSCPVYQAAEKKALIMPIVTRSLRRAVGIVSDPKLEYKAPLQCIGVKSRATIEKVLNMAALVEGQSNKFLCLKKT